MKKFKKIFIPIIVIFLVLYYIVPFFVGISAEKEFNSMVKELGRELNTKVKSEYNRGWFSSKAKISFDVQNIAATFNPNFAELFSDTYFKSKYKINHGLFPFTGNFKNRTPLVPVIAVLQGNSFLSNNLFNKDLKVKSSAVIKLDGGLGGTLVLPKQRFFARNIDELFVQLIPAEITFSVSRDFDKAEMSIDLPKADFSNKETSGKINEIKISSNFLKKKGKFPIGETKIKIGKIVLKERKNKTNEFNFTNFSFSKELNEKNNLVYGGVKISFDKFDIPQKKFGPAEFELTFKNLDSKILLELQTAANELKLDKSKGSSLMFLSKFTALLPEFINKSPEFELTKFKLKTQYGNFSGYLKAKIKGDNFNKFTKPKNDIDKLYIEANLTIPEDFVKENPLTNSFVEFVKEGKQYKTDILLKNGVFTVNGKERKDFDSMFKL